jgi:transcriptional regulator of acetoin/glycerol metabolism
MTEQDSFAQDIAFLRSCEKRLGSIIAAIEGMGRWRRLQETLDALLERNGGTVLPLAETERTAILSAVHKCGGDYQKAAKALGIGRTTLYRKMRDYDCDARRRA